MLLAGSAGFEPAFLGRQLDQEAGLEVTRAVEVPGPRLIVSGPGVPGRMPPAEVSASETPTDATPEQTAEILDYEVPGLADAIRRSGLPQVPTAVLSRGRCGVAGRTLIVNLPGSTGGVRDALAVLEPVIAHALSQVRGGDH